MENVSLSNTGKSHKNEDEKDKKTRRRKRAKRRRVRKKKRGGKTVCPTPTQSDSINGISLNLPSQSVSVSKSSVNAAASNAAANVWNLLGKQPKPLSPKKNPTMKWSQLCHKDPKSKLNVLVLKIWRRAEVLRYRTNQNNDAKLIQILK